VVSRGPRQFHVVLHQNSIVQYCYPRGSRAMEALRIGASQVLCGMRAVSVETWRLPEAAFESASETRGVFITQSAGDFLDAHVRLREEVGCLLHSLLRK